MDIASPNLDTQESQTLDLFSTALDWAPCSNNDCHVVDGDSTILCHPGSRLLRSTFTKPDCNEVVMLVNSGCEAMLGEDSSMNFMADTFYEGGEEVFMADDQMSEGGEFSYIYHSARQGNFYYKFQNIPPGDYFVDLHFMEIKFTYGPKGIRVFNVYMQDEKVLSELDIFSVVGSNKPLQLVDSRVSVNDDGLIVIRFEGVSDSPLVSGICIRKAPAPEVKHEYLICSNCSSEVEVPTDQRVVQMRSTTQYEKKIEELSAQCQMKTNECFQAWMSLTQANEQLEKVRMELDNKLFQTFSLDQAVVKQAEEIRTISSRYDHDKKFWIRAVHNLEDKIKALKKEQAQLSREAHECADSIPELNQMVFAVQSLVAQCEDLKVKYSEEQAKRRKLHNDFEEVKGNIRVFCRCRPLNKGEVGAGYATVVDFEAAKEGELCILGGSMKKIYKFDRVYSPRDDQANVYEDASPLVTSVLDGYNVCIFAYGQTGTGKTFTMEGTEQNRGVNYRTLEELFNIAKERSETHTYSISVSVLEVYNEQIRDLLSASPSSKKLEIKQASEGYHHVPGLVEAKVKNIREVWNVLQAGSSARTVGSNNVNEHSSRSHCMLCVIVSSKNLMNGECTKSKLWLVDLAGSERLAKTDVHGDCLKEAQNINRSLSALGDVISALAVKSSHIPYRNSKLTHLLQDSLGGDSKTLMFVQISPSENDLSETTSSLNFATRVRGVDLGPAKKQIDTGEIHKMKMMLDKVRQESRSKDEALRKLEESFQSFESKAKGKEQFYKNQLEKIKELEGQLELKTALQSQSEKQALNLSEKLKGKDEICTCLQQKVKELEGKLRERAQSESATYEQVKDLENKLKDQMRNSESLSVTLQRKVEELERKLQEKQELHAESSLRQKIKELEDKLRKQAPELSCKKYMEVSDAPRTTPRERRHSIVRDWPANDSDSQILKSSNLTNRRGTPVSTTICQGKDNINETERKRLSRNSETENRNTEMNYCNEKKSRRSDPPKPFPRVAKKVVPVSTSQKPLTHSRTGTTEQAQGVKDRDSKKRVWSR